MAEQESEEYSREGQMMEQMSNHIVKVGVLFTSPRIHIKMLASFTREIPAADMAELYSHCSQADSSVEQVTMLVYFCLMLCLDAYNSRACELVRIKGSIQPFAQAIVDSRLEGGSKRLSKSDCIDRLADWMGELSVHEMTDAEMTELEQLKMQLERAQRAEADLRRQSIMESNALRRRLAMFRETEEHYRTLADLVSDASSSSDYESVHSEGEQDTGGSAARHSIGGGESTHGRPYSSESRVITSDEHFRLVKEKNELAEQASLAIESLRSEVARLKTMLINQDRNIKHL